MDDADAIRRLKSGDISGLEYLMRRYQVKAARAAFLITRDGQSARDVVQDTFIRMYAGIRGFDETRRFEPYLMRSVVHNAINAVRKTARWGDIDGLEGMARAEGLLDGASTVEEQVDFSLQKQEILAALDRLNPRQRAVIVQRYYLGMDEREMAGQLQVAPGTVKWLLHSARNRLRTLLRRERSAK
jgi:RNA polymerase sigma-70 factor (ECF subfamily)